MKIYNVYCLRYGDESLGKYFFGSFSSKEKAIKEAKEYNIFRGGKYPEIEIIETELDKEIIFKEKREIVKF